MYNRRMARVYLIPARADDPEEEIARKIRHLWERASLGECFLPNDLTAVKLHVGEPGKTTFVSPGVVTPLVRLLKERGARPFLTDSAVLYRSPRDTGAGHTAVAHEHGFTLERVGAPFLPADGLTGADEVEMETCGKHFDTASIAAAVARASSLLVLTHATGHLATGFGGALKNIGMGCSSKKGKLRQHFGRQPDIDGVICTGCEACAADCPEEAIGVDRVAVIDSAKCIGCGACVAACLEGAVRFDWEVGGAELQERVVEYAGPIVAGRRGRLACVTVAMNITKDCDCLGSPQHPVCDDIGILASRDPVAIDQVFLDLVRERTGTSLESLTYPDHDGSVQTAYAEELGLGERGASLILIE